MGIPVKRGELVAQNTISPEAPAGQQGQSHRGVRVTWDWDSFYWNDTRAS